MLLTLSNLRIFFKKAYTLKPVLRGQLWKKEKWSSKTGDLLKEVQFIYQVFYDRTRKR